MEKDQRQSDSSVKYSSQTGTENNNLRQVEKLANIAEIMELLEETPKNEDWIIAQIKQKGLKINVNSSMKSITILKSCPTEFVSYLLAVLRSKEEDFESPPPLTKMYHWFFTDIVASSEPSITTTEQARKIIVLNKLIEKTTIFKEKDQQSTLIIPTGDGVAIGFHDSPEKPLLLAVELHELLKKYNISRPEKDAISIRIGLDSGPVYIIRDLTGKENVWGPGIITARRVMDLAKPMNILASANIANAIGNLKPEIKRYLHLLGDYSVKHGTALIYNVYDKDRGIGNFRAPSKDKVQKSKAVEEDLNTGTRFLFNDIKIRIEIIGTSNMLAHHSLVWDFVNVSDNHITDVFYYLDGDAPRSFPELNIRIRDNQEKDLEIQRVNMNKPYHKEFFIKLDKPLKPKERTKITLEYDWEESDRHFYYVFAADCKRFEFFMHVPQDVDVKHAVFKVFDNGVLKYPKTPAHAKALPDGTHITWSGSDLHWHDKYRFDW